MIGDTRKLALWQIYSHANILELSGYPLDQLAQITEQLGESLPEIQIPIIMALVLFWLQLFFFLPSLSSLPSLIDFLRLLLMKLIKFRRLVFSRLCLARAVQIMVASLYFLSATSSLVGRAFSSKASRHIARSWETSNVVTMRLTAALDPRCCRSSRWPSRCRQRKEVLDWPAKLFRRVVCLPTPSENNFRVVATRLLGFKVYDCIVA